MLAGVGREGVEEEGEEGVKRREHARIRDAGG